MEDLISPYSGDTLYKDGDYYKNNSDDFLYTVLKSEKVITLMDPICAGKLESLGNDFFYSEELNKNFLLDRSREIILPLFLDDENIMGEEASYDGLSLIGNETGRKVVVDDRGERLTGIELLRRKSNEFQGIVAINKVEKDIYSNMSDNQKKAYDLSNKQVEDYTMEDITYMIDQVVGEYKDDEYLSLARSAMVEIFKIQLSNRPLKEKQETETENNEDRAILNDKIEQILFSPQEKEYEFEEYHKPLDYDERVYSIGMSVLESGIESMSREDYEYLYNAVDKKKAFENYELDYKDLKVMDVSLEYLKSQEIARSK